MMYDRYMTLSRPSDDLIQKYNLEKIRNKFPTHAFTGTYDFSFQFRLHDCLKKTY